VLAALALSWPFLMFRGAFGIVFGVIVLAWPGLEPTDVALLFGAYAFSDGVLATVVALSARDVPGFVGLFVEAVIRAAAGLIIVAAPALAAPRLLDIVTAWMFLSGISAFLIALPLAPAVIRKSPAIDRRSLNSQIRGLVDSQIANLLFNLPIYESANL